jgi:hypothetical protein
MNSKWLLTETKTTKNPQLIKSGSATILLSGMYWLAIGVVTLVLVYR